MDGRIRAALRARSLGLPGGKRRRRMFLGALAPIAVLGVVLISNAFAIHDVGLFELDRNAQDENTAGDDWDTLAGDTTGPAGNSLIFSGILPDIVSATNPGDQFTGGGSKDDLDIPSWRWKEGEPLDKDDITNAYSAGYTIPDGSGTTDNHVGDFVVYFGLDRFDTSGSAQVGFWFLKDGVTQTTTKKNGAFTFSGTHKTGDILVQSNFSNGGNVDSVAVYQWVNGSLQQVETAGDCLPSSGPPLANDIACATVNKSSTSSPWLYIPKGASADSDFPTSAFYEGGINLTRLARESGTSTGCLSTFLAETRSSTPFNAALKDLDLGDFDTCDASMTTQSDPKTTNVAPGASVTDTAIITGTSLVGGSPQRPTGSVKFYLCQPADVTSAGCPATKGALVSTDSSLDANPPNPPDNDSIAVSDATTNTTAVGKYCWRAEYTPDTASSVFYSAQSHTNADVTVANSECFEVPAQPTTTTTRQFLYPQDRAKLTAPTATGDLDGDVYFRLFDTKTNCDADDGTANATGLKYASGAIAVDGASTGQERKTNNTTYAIDSSKTTTHFWHVIYDADPGSPGSSTDRGNAKQLDSESDCVESTAVTFAGDDGTITVPGTANP